MSLSMRAVEAFIELFGGKANIVDVLDGSDDVALIIIVATMEMVDASSLIEFFGRKNIDLVEHKGSRAIKIETSQGNLWVMDLYSAKLGLSRLH